jgi:hypothetical protein
LSVSGTPLSQRASRPDGVWTRSPRTHKRHVLVSLFHYPVFRERLASAGAVAGWETYARHPFPSSFFLAGIFFSRSQDVRLASHIHRSSGVPICSLLLPSGSPLRRAGFSFGLLSEAGGTGWLEGRRGLPRTLFPVKRLFAAKFSLRAPGGRSPHVAEARDRLSPIGSARQDQFMGARPPQHGDSAHRSWREQTPGATEHGAIASEP